MQRPSLGTIGSRQIRTLVRLSVMWHRCPMANQRLVGGFDCGSELVDGTVRRLSRPWTASVHLLLAHLAAAGFKEAPVPLGVDDQGREVLSFLPGETVGSSLPWPKSTHSEEALAQVADWLRHYHEAASDFVPPEDATWREGRTWRPGSIVAHNDAAPYNAVWNASGLVGFVDWDMAGPMTKEADVAWMLFSWVPLHARSVVAAEGFTGFSSRRERVRSFLTFYQWEGNTSDAIRLVATRIEDQLRSMRETAQGGDPAYRRMLALGRDKDLEAALRELADL